MAKKRKLRKGFKISFIVIALALVGTLGWFVKQNMPKKQTEQVSSVVETIEPEPTPTPEPIVQSASLFMVGDALLHDPIELDAANGDGTYSFTLLDRIGAIAANYDLRYYNQETILGGDEFGIRGYPQFNGVQAWGDYMRSLGFNMVSLANNHSLDMGIRGIENSMNYWHQFPEVVTSGTYLSQEEYDAIPVHEVNGITYAFISSTYGMNGLYPPEGYEYMVDCYENRIDALLQKVRSAKEQADVVITAIHWGDEYHLEVNEFQRTFAQQLADAGADIIIGNHPHCIEPIEWFNDHTICFYALGNVVASQYDVSEIEMMAGLTIEKTTYPDGTKNIEIKDAKADLMYLYRVKGANVNYDVIPFSQMDDAHLPGYQAVYDQYRPVITAMTDRIQVGGF